MSTPVRTRFAPSPTGPLHIGGVRTALFNFLFARKHGGTFILRIEDTDRSRFVPGAEEYIVESLQWCGIKIDEGVSVGGTHDPYRQSERMKSGTYDQFAKQLIAKGHAYYAFDTPEEIEVMRQRRMAEGDSAPQYNHQTRSGMRNSLNMVEVEVRKLIEEGKPFVIRLKVDPGVNVVFEDMIRGEVSFDSTLVDDKVLIKSDGMPTYHLAHIVDDLVMEITHAIRGEEWLPSAPAHILIYRFLGYENRMPLYAHLPLLLKPDGHGKLSKRDGDRLGFPVFPLNWKDPVTGEVSSGYREKGYYPEAFVNMLALLGWNPGTEQEIFSMEELCNSFSMEHVHKAGAKFDPDKARWFNEQYLRAQPDEKIAERLRPLVLHKFSLNENDTRVSAKYLVKIAGLMKERVQFEHEIPDTGKFLFVAPDEYDLNLWNKKFKEPLRDFFLTLEVNLVTAVTFSADEIDRCIKTTTQMAGVKPGEVMQLLRILVSGSGSGPDLLGMMELLGKDEVCLRIRNGMDRLASVKS
jgi:glutamyl-tRNA synthetase